MMSDSDFLLPNFTGVPFVEDEEGRRYLTARQIYMYGLMPFIKRNADFFRWGHDSDIYFFVRKDETECPS